MPSPESRDDYDDDDCLPALIDLDDSSDDEQLPTLTPVQRPIASRRHFVIPRRLVSSPYSVADCEYFGNSASCDFATAPVAAPASATSNAGFASHIAVKTWVDRHRIDYDRLRKDIRLVQKHDPDRCIVLDGVAAFSKRPGAFVVGWPIGQPAGWSAPPRVRVAARL